MGQRHWGYCHKLRNSPFHVVTQGIYRFLIFGVFESAPNVWKFTEVSIYLAIFRRRRLI